MKYEPDYIWHKATPLLPRWVAGRFRRKGLEYRAYLVGSSDYQQLVVEWRVAQ